MLRPRDVRRETKVLRGIGEPTHHGGRSSLLSSSQSSLFWQKRVPGLTYTDLQIYASTPLPVWRFCGTVRVGGLGWGRNGEMMVVGSKNRMQTKTGSCAGEVERTW